MVDNAALLDALRRGSIAGAALDVWEGEPAISMELLERAALGTPHIAGYSFDGKVNGTEMIYRAACLFLEVEPTWRAAEQMPASPLPILELNAGGKSAQDIVAEAVRKVYPIERDDAALREMLSLAPDQRHAHFDRLRKEYPVRREFFNTTVKLEGRAPEAARAIAMLSGIGFKALPAGD